MRKVFLQCLRYAAYDEVYDPAYDDVYGEEYEAVLAESDPEYASMVANAEAHDRAHKKALKAARSHYSGLYAVYTGDLHI